MIEFGVRNVIVESNHHGQAIEMLLERKLRVPRPEWWTLRNEGGGYGYDIAVTRDANTYADTWKSLSPGWRNVRCDADPDACRRAAKRLLQDYVLLVEVKKYKKARGEIVKGIRNDLIKLAATSHAMTEFAEGSSNPATVFVLVAQSSHDSPPERSQFLEDVRSSVQAVLDNCADAVLPEVFYVSPDEVVRLPVDDAPSRGTEDAARRGFDLVQWRSATTIIGRQRQRQPA
jgi:hypothetical protein